jgi:glucose/arabinose dehydrogenase
MNHRNRNAGLALAFVLILPGRPALAADDRGPARGPVDVELHELRPGLVARYRSLVDKEASLVRIDAKPAFCLGHANPHLRIPPGPFEVTWGGTLFVSDPAPITFEAYLCGELAMEVDGVPVLRGRGETETAHLGANEPWQRGVGVHRLKIHYRSLPTLPARLQIWWQGPTFTREPLPPWHLHHLSADLPADLQAEQQIDEGRKAVTAYGCCRCHRSAFPGVAEPPPGPSLADAARRINRGWLLDWLDDPAKVRPGARMPALFSADRTGFVERWMIADYLLGHAAAGRPGSTPTGDHRLGRRVFVSLGCAACHFVPDITRAEQPDFDRTALTGLNDRLPPEDLSSFLSNPQARYPDGRMPRLPLTPERARDLAAYLLMWSRPARADLSSSKPPTEDEIHRVARRLGVEDLASGGLALIREKRCTVCHVGLGDSLPVDVPLRMADDRSGCLSGKSLPRYTLDGPTHKAMTAYRAVSAREKHVAPFLDRQRLIERLGCLRCHQRDSDRPPALEVVSSTLGVSSLESLPYQRTPRLTYPHQKYLRSYLQTAVGEGVSGLRSARYTYRMPAFGAEAASILQALAEGDGELPSAADAPQPPVADPTLGPLAGPSLVGFQGYACVSCHLWNGRKLADPDPGAAGTDLTRVTPRIRRDWLDRFLEGPARAHPGTPMPAIFRKDKPALLVSVLNGDVDKQRDALWAYFSLGKEAPSPKPAPPVPVASPSAGAPPLVAQIPVRLPGGSMLESICLLAASHDLVVYDLGTGSLHSCYTGAQLLAQVQGRLRRFTVSGKLVGTSLQAEPALQLAAPGKQEMATRRTFQGYDRLADGVRLRWQAEFASGTVQLEETLRLDHASGKRTLSREFAFAQVPAGCSILVRSRALGDAAITIAATVGQTTGTSMDGIFRAELVPDLRGTVTATLRYELPASQEPPLVERAILPDAGTSEGSLERPGYRAVAYPRPKTAAGEDRILPSALAVNPRDGRVFVASLKTGELFVLRNPNGDGKAARFENYAHGLFQEALAMLAEPDALYVLHRRNLTRIVETEKDGVANRFERVAALPQGIADTYDYGYGLVRDRSGAFVYTHAPYADTKMPGAGGALRLLPGNKPQEIAFGFRNPLGWCTGPEGEIFFTDNQGEWVATNKLCHLVEGRFYGFPNPGQPQHVARPRGKTAVWIPYSWARSINGVVYDRTAGKFGPFAGQFFLAELMFGGAIVRASLEKVNGEYQGACFPFWGPGLLGPLTLTFDPRGRLFVGSITEPGWMAQPDRGALFRIDYTGVVPFEMQSIHLLPRGFRIRFTKPVNAASARLPAAYQIEHYRYEYTGAYGSPELDRTPLTIDRVQLSADGLSADLLTGPLLKDRVYLLRAAGVRAQTGEALVFPTAAYTVNEIPAE